MYSMMNSSTELTNFVLNSLKNLKLVGNDSTIVLTGSASLECARASPDYRRYFNGESDIDVLVIIYKDISFMNTIFSKHILNLFNNNNINVLNYSYQYGNIRNAINIKYIKENTFIEWTSLTEVHFKSYRKYSLSAKKPYMKCYGFSDSVIIPYQEEPNTNYYILHYDIELKEKYYLLDIHTMILFGTIISNRKPLKYVKNFNLFFKSLLNYSDEKIFNLFKYYLEDKKSINYSELKMFIKMFTEMGIEEILEILKRKGIISEIRGTIKENSQLATICWARSNPKAVFDFMNKVNTYITHKAFILIIDDMCPKILYKRSDTEQEEINQKYLAAFTDCTICFSSDIFKVAIANNFMEEFINMMMKISLNYYIDFLPEKKKYNLQSVKLEEFIHTFCELFLLNYGEKKLGIDAMIFGKFSQNITFLAKQQVFKNSKLNYIIIPRINEEEMNSLFPITK